MSDEDICRDYLRNVCRRGKDCKYQHPNEADESGLKKTDLVFCHDYQNKDCHRPNCKFIHCTRQEEELFHQSGELPEHVTRMVNAMNGGPKKGDVPICKDFLKGDCRRGGRCKFRHLSSNELDTEIGRSNGSRMVRRDREEHDHFDVYEQRDSFEPNLKRRHYDDHFNGPFLPTPERHSYTSSALNDYDMMQEVNLTLRRKLEVLRKHIADLTATNEFLLEQNAQLRLTKPNVAVTQAPPQGLTPQQQNPANVPQSLAAQLSQQLPITANRADLSATAQSLSVPVSLAQALAPVSIASVSIAQQQMPTVAAVSLAQSMPQSVITMSGPTTPLVSYPIMTQSMRPPLSQSSLTH